MKCELCGEMMPSGEEMFKYHGYSGPCPKPPIEKAMSEPMREFWIYKKGKGAEDIDYMQMKPGYHLEDFIHVREVDVAYEDKLDRAINFIRMVGCRCQEQFKCLRCKVLGEIKE